MPVRILKSLFDRLGIDYECIRHPARMTAMETAAAEGEYPACHAKVVIVRAGGRHQMFVIPADRRLDLFKAAEATGCDDVCVEYEYEFGDVFPDCETGAMPPFGSMYGLPCYLDEALTFFPAIVFNAGSHTESIKLATQDYVRLALPVIGDYSAWRSKATS